MMKWIKKIYTRLTGIFHKGKTVTDNEVEDSVRRSVPLSEALREWKRQNGS